MRERRRRVRLRGGHTLAVVPVETRATRLRRQALTLVLLLAIPAAGWLGWDAALRSQKKVIQEHEILLNSHLEMQADLVQAQERYQQLEVDLLVSREAALDSRQVISQLEQQLFRLQQDLATYQGALAPNAMIPGLRIQAFELQATDDDRIFRYKVMVSRVGNESDTTQAQLFLEVEGIQAGKDVTLPLSELTPTSEEDGLGLNFRYFQVVPASSSQAELRLPEGFEPTRVRLRAEHDGKKLVEQIFDWVVIGAKP